MANEKSVLSDETQSKLSGIIKEAEKIITSIQTERDRLREIHDELEDILTSVDEATDEFKDSFEHAIDTLSQYI